MRVSLRTVGQRVALSIALSIGERSPFDSRGVRFGRRYSTRPVNTPSGELSLVVQSHAAFFAFRDSTDMAKHEKLILVNETSTR